MPTIALSAGLSHDAVVQLVWYFPPLQISSNVDVPGQEKVGLRT